MLVVGVMASYFESLVSDVMAESQAVEAAASQAAEAQRSELAAQQAEQKRVRIDERR